MGQIVISPSSKSLEDFYLGKHHNAFSILIGLVLTIASVVVKLRFILVVGDNCKVRACISNSLSCCTRMQNM